MSIPAVRVEGLTKSYGQTRAVNGIDFIIETGEVVAILGPNGAGKTVWGAIGVLVAIRFFSFEPSAGAGRSRNQPASISD